MKALCNAPRIDPETLAGYFGVIEDDIAEPLRASLLQWAKAVERYNQGHGATFWAMGTLDHHAAACERLTGKPRDVAFHLLWYMREFALGHEPRVMQ